MNWPTNPPPKVKSGIKERDIQSHLVAWLRLHDYLFEGSLAGEGYRSPVQAARAKAQGITPGMPDLHIYLAGGKTLFIELKGPRGSLSPAQKDVHEKLIALGHEVHVIKSPTPFDALENLIKILGGR